jgi:mono/diheme cytochrome c family protein
MAAPPLNGTGHAWHHPLKWLFRTISEGGTGGMPGWREELSPGEILAVIAWFQSHWSDEIYDAWSRMDAAAGNEA